MNIKDNRILVRYDATWNHPMWDRNPVLAAEFYVNSLTGDNKWQWEDYTAEERTHAHKVLSQLAGHEPLADWERELLLGHNTTIPEASAPSSWINDEEPGGTLRQRLLLTAKTLQNGDSVWDFAITELVAHTLDVDVFTAQGMIRRAS